jgi:hypothetical protein
MFPSGAESMTETDTGRTQSGNLAEPGPDSIGGACQNNGGLVTPIKETHACDQGVGKVGRCGVSPW